ncbi:MAG: hypothetical protein FH756_14505 [Firmicutes bacterium]|nr:hypothetical protein [Bacillota bacterium]
MPRGDRTGPLGQGVKTGRGAGLCSSNSVPGFANRHFRGRSGRGMGWSAQGAQQDNDSGVIGQFKSLRERLNSIEQKIKG